MKEVKNIDVKVSIGTCLLVIITTCYLWTYVNGGNHWKLFGTKTEAFLTTYGFLIILLSPGLLIFPLFLKRDKVRWITALMSIPVFIFLYYSLIVFLD